VVRARGGGRCAGADLCHQYEDPLSAPAAPPGRHGAGCRLASTRPSTTLKPAATKRGQGRPEPSNTQRAVGKITHTWEGICFPFCDLPTHQPIGTLFVLQVPYERYEQHHPHHPRQPTSHAYTHFYMHITSTSKACIANLRKKWQISSFKRCILIPLFFEWHMFPRFFPYCMQISREWL